MARYAISDIHGCLKTFQTMVQEHLHLQPQDQLYLLGDYINKGPDSKGVLDYIFDLQQRGFHVTCLRGNHDQLLLDAVDKGEETVWLTPEEKAKTLQNFGVKQFQDIPEHYISFIRNLPLLILLEDYILVHAGLDFTLANPFATDSATCMNLKHMVPSSGKLAGRTLIRGHVPTSPTTIQKAVDLHLPVIPLDAGCVFYRNVEFGMLCALNLDNRTLFFLPNKDKPYPIKVK